MGRVRLPLRRRPSFTSWRSGPQGRPIVPPGGTRLYLNPEGSTWGAGWRSVALPRLDGTVAPYGNTHLLHTSPHNALNAASSFTFPAGPTNGIEVSSTGSTSTEWVSLPIDSPVTISGPVMFNLWGNQPSPTSDAALNGILEKIDVTTGAVTVIAQSAGTTELSVSPSVSLVQYLLTPSSTLLNKGDRLRFRPYWDDAPVMGSGSTGSFQYGKSDVPGATGDTWLKFTETLTFQTTEPTGTVLYLNSTSGPDVGSADEKEMWTSRGAASTTAVIDTVNGVTSPLQWTATSGGSVIEWYSRPLQAFTLSGLVRANMRAFESSTTADASLMVELAIVNGDGSGANVFGILNIRNQGSIAGFDSTTAELSSTDNVVAGWVSGHDISVTSGQRLRLRPFLVDARDTMAAGFTATLSYDGPTANNAGDAWIQLPQSVLEAIGPTILGYWS